MEKETRKPAEGAEPGGKPKKKLNELWGNSRRALLIVAFGVTLFQLLQHLKPVMTAVNEFLNILEPVFLGVVIAFLASMPVHFLETRVFAKWKHEKARRMLSTLLSFIFIFAVVAAVAFLVVPKLVDSIVSLAEGFDGYISGLTTWGDKIWNSVNFSPGTEEKIRELVMDVLSGVDELLSGLMSYALQFTISVLSFAVSLLVAVIIGFYAVYNKEKLIFGGKKFVVAALSEERARRALDVCSRTYSALHDYMLGMIADCTCLGVMTYIMMRIFNFPYPELISVVIGVTQIIPIVGPWVSGAFGVLIILVADPPSVIWFAIGEIIVQQIDNNLIYPRIVGRAVGLSGIWVLIAVVLGGGLFGFVGIVLCVPVTAVIYTLVSEWINRRVEEKRFAKGMREDPPTEDEIRDMTEP